MLLYDADNEQALTEWEYIPPVGPRPVKGFVGLKNAGATCYMNSVTQQVCGIWLYSPSVINSRTLITTCWTVMIESSATIRVHFIMNLSLKIAQFCVSKICCWSDTRPCMIIVIMMSCL